MCVCVYKFVIFIVPLEFLVRYFGLSPSVPTFVLLLADVTLVGSGTVTND